MNWYNILIGISKLGVIISLLVVIVIWVLSIFNLKSGKYRGKLVEETPLIRYLNVMYTGIILAGVFAVILGLFR